VSGLHWPVGSRVKVGPAYTQERGYVPDGHEGEWYVVRLFHDGFHALARHPGDECEIEVHISRITILPPARVPS
jgi:hypothetical protein